MDVIRPDIVARAVDVSRCTNPGIISTQLSSLLSLIVPSSSSKKASPVLLGVSERTLASAIQGQLHIPCDTGERTLELVRGIRLHAENLLAKAGTGMEKGDVKLAQLGLGHSYSRGKVKVREIVCMWETAWLGANDTSTSLAARF